MMTLIGLLSWVTQYTFRIGLLFQNKDDYVMYS